MKKNLHLYVSRKHPLTWLMALCMVSSAVIRMVFPGLKGSGETLNMWNQILLPAAASLLYVLIVYLRGELHFYETAIPIWMMALYCALWIAKNVNSTVITWLFWIALIFFAGLYTQASAGRSKSAIVLLLLSTALPLAFVLYCDRAFFLTANLGLILPFLPTLLSLLGAFLLTFALRIHTCVDHYPTWGDRSDGRRIRTLPPMSQVSPYIMVSRNESFVLFENSIEITPVERYIRQKRAEGLKHFGITHVLLAAYVRTLCRYPAINRFLSGQRIYSRGEDIVFCMTIKKEMTTESPDTIVKVHLNPHDTAADVYQKLQSAVEEVKQTPLESHFDNVAGLFNLIPGVFLKLVVWLLKLLDYFGLLLPSLLEVSPFHGSLFFTSMGSLGIPPVYHHLYNFGNMPAFGAFGCKRRVNELMEDGSVVVRKYVDVRFTVDERIADGFTYAAFFKHFKRILIHPEALDTPPETVNRDID